ncbi:MAG TPA: lytic murein transglycosylase [Gaiellaceae bacterium]|nr:lytic murein transglycosylase [Gaiellaceae bacterium]
MRRLAPVALLLALAASAGNARADTFAVVSTPQFAVVTLPSALPSAALPNTPGAVATPADLAAAPAVPVTLSGTGLLDLWQQAGAAYGIPWQVLAAINKVESNFGRTMGPSSAGAVGWMQFMPSTWLRWGVDANGDGIADPWNPQDAVYSAARYLAASGGAADLTRAIYAYNHADWYVGEVLGLASVYGQSTGTVLSLDRLQQSLDEARTAVSTASNRLVAARARAREIAAEAAVWQRRAAAATLLSNRLADEQRAGRIGERRRAADAVAARQAAALDAARTQLEQARQAAAPATFSATTAPLLGGPTYASGWAFPVGGGPGAVSVSHTHRGAPAADIAAPEGSPVYAIAQSVVVSSWARPDPQCGIGLTLRTADGREWTYCHLSYLEPGVVAGAQLGAGQPVGLVGSTGDATGPHLHLQLQPATGYPQDESWFQAFAGTAFSWQDAQAGARAQAQAQSQPLRFLSVLPASAPPPVRAPVFAVVPAATRAATPVVFFSRSGP